MPDCYHVSTDQAVKEAEEVFGLGIPSVMVFGLPPSKDPMGTGAYAENGIVQESVAAIKKALPDLVVITDVCLCEYTDHGHCGIVKERNGQLDVDNDATLELLALQAVSHARAGSDVIAPSGMMDGMVKAIRHGLDGQGFEHLPILSYAIKYASAFYGPFRDAVDSAPQFGDRRTYQMDPANGREALRELHLDVQEGADIVMVKPALSFLDVIRQARESHPEIPLAAYNVSGEYAMVKAAAANGWLDERRIVEEILTSIKRAGADMIVTYFAKDVAHW